MESERFDSLSKLLVRSGPRRGAVATIAALAGLGIAAIDGLDAKKKKKKKKKKKPQCTTCTAPGEFCGSESFCKCCDGLPCIDDVCCLPQGSDCGFGTPSCCGTLVCKPFGDGVCQSCVLTGGTCNGVEDCCSNNCTCVDNKCVVCPDRG